VKKGQVLVRIDDDEPRADVRAKEAALAELKAGLARLRAHPREEERAELRAALQSAQISASEARHALRRIEPGYQSGAISEARYHETKAALLRQEADEQVAIARLQQLLKKPIKEEFAEMEAKVAGAQASLETARAELEHYTVVAPIDGVVAWLEVSPGTVSRPGTTVWGEILDLREIDVLCPMTPGQAAVVTVGQAARVLGPGNKPGPWDARVVSVGVAADPRTGRIPVRVRVREAGEQLPCYVEVKVRIIPGPASTPGS